MAEITIMPSDDGPYIVKGGAKLVDATGRQFEVKGTVLLCRCGGSGTKPFCDGTHARGGFKDQSRAG